MKVILSARGRCRCGLTPCVTSPLRSRGMSSGHITKKQKTMLLAASEWGDPAGRCPGSAASRGDPSVASRVAGGVVFDKFCSSSPGA